MVVLHGYVKTASACITMKIVALADTTNPTAIAMVHSLLLMLVIIQTAYLAEVFRKIFLARYACFRLYLLCLAPKTLDMSDFVPVQFVILLGVHLILKK